MILKTRLQDYATFHQSKWEIVEQDYVLSWVLAGMTFLPELSSALVFKGGTCLRKCYFGDYRFSQDIDLSVMGNSGSLESSLENHIHKACVLAEELVQDQGTAFYLRSEPYLEKRPHPEGQKAFRVQAKLPWHRDFNTTIYIEVSFSEAVILPPVQKKIIHPYGEQFDYSINAYDINEIVAEKIRALLQFAKKLHERGWGRSRVRDYYDLWRILSFYREDISKAALPDLVRKKCAHKEIDFKGIESIFQEKLLLNFEEEWEFWLKDVVGPDLPDRHLVLKDLREQLTKIFHC